MNSITHKFKSKINSENVSVIAILFIMTVFFYRESFSGGMYIIHIFIGSTLTSLTADTIIFEQKDKFRPFLCITFVLYSVAALL